MPDAIINEQGQSVYPSESAPFIDDSKAIFDTDLYEKLKNPSPTPEDQPAPEQGATGSEVVEPVTEPVVETVAPDFDSVIKERTNGKFEKWDDLLSKVEEKEKPVELPANSKKILEALQKGEEDPIADYLFQKRLLANIDKLSNEDKVKLKLQMERPELTPEEVKEEYEMQYGLDVDEDEVSPERLEKLKKKQARDIALAARGAEAYLTEVKNGLTLPEIKLDDKSEYYQTLETEQKQFEEMNQKLFSSLDKEISDFRDIDLSFTDKDVQFTHKFDITEDERKGLADQVKNFWETFKSRYYKDDQWQVKDLLRDQYVTNNLPKIMKSAVSKASTLSKVGTVQEIANVTPDKAGMPSANFADEAALEAKRRFILA